MKSTSTRRTRPVRRWLLALAVAATFAGAPGYGEQAAPGLRAEIRRTAGGIPHVRAGDWAGLGYGTGYVMAQDNLCLLARNFLRVNGRLSQYLGPGIGGGNRTSDFFFRMLIEEGLGEEKIAEEFDQLFRGYAAGYTELRSTRSTR